MASEKNIEDVILESLTAWRSNLIIGLPFFLNTIVGLFLFVAYVAFVYFFANPFSNLATGDFISAIRSINWLLLFLDLCLAFVLFVLMLLVSAFFMSGAIGMSMNALTKGETRVGDLFHYGRKHFIKVFFANIVILIIIMIVVAVALVPQALLKGQYVNIATMVLGMLFAPVPYAVVLSNSGMRGGLKKGTSLAWNNKLETILIYVFVTSLSSLLTLIALAAIGLIAALVVALIPVQELSWVGVTSAVSTSIPLIIIGFVISAIIYMAALILVAEPIGTICWSNYYLSQKGK